MATGPLLEINASQVEKYKKNMFINETMEEVETSNNVKNMLKYE